MSDLLAGDLHVQAFLGKYPEQQLDPSSYSVTFSAQCYSWSLLAILGITKTVYIYMYIYTYVCICTYKYINTYIYACTFFKKKFILWAALSI